MERSRSSKWWFAPAVAIAMAMAVSSGAVQGQDGSPALSSAALGNPTGLRIIRAEERQVQIAWEAADNAEINWIWSVQPDGTGGKWTRAGASANSATVSELEPGRSYWFIVIAGRTVQEAQEWSLWSNWVMARTSAVGLAPVAQNPVTIQLACINRTLPPCQLVRDFYAPRVRERTGGAVTIEISSFPELGVAGADTLRRLKDHSLAAAEVYSGYVGAHYPILDIENLWGLVPTNETQLAVSDAVNDDLADILSEATGGEVIFRSFYPSQYIFSRAALPDLASYRGNRVRSHSTILGDLLLGLGAEPQFAAFADVYTALERGVIDSAVTGGSPAYSQRWFEVADYLYGPIPGSIGITYFTVSGEVWSQLTKGSRSILRQVGKEYEAENRRLLKIEWELDGINLNVERGMTHSDFPDDVKAKMRETAINVIIPNWIDRVGGPDSRAVRIFNEKVGPLVGVGINPDGSATETHPTTSE